MVFINMKFNWRTMHTRLWSLLLLVLSTLSKVYITKVNHDPDHKYYLKLTQIQHAKLTDTCTSYCHRIKKGILT